MFFTHPPPERRARSKTQANMTCKPPGKPCVGIILPAGSLFVYFNQKFLSIIGLDGF
jgi:hypothetical protein